MTVHDAAFSRRMTSFYGATGESMGSMAVESGNRLRQDLSYSMNTERRLYKEDSEFRNRVRTENTLFVDPQADLETQAKANEYVSSISKFIF